MSLHTHRHSLHPVCGKKGPIHPPWRPFMIFPKIISLSALLLLVAPLCFASGEEEHRQHGSHVHGLGQMNLAIDGTEVYIELENPSANIVGFEHMPSSAEDRHAVQEAVEKLEDGESLFLFTSQADCSLTSAAVSSSLLLHDHEDDHRDGTQEHADHGEEVHSEFTAEYRFSCTRPEKLKSVETTLFSVFPGIEKIGAQVLTSTRQTGAELTAKNYRIEL